MDSYRRNYAIPLLSIPLIAGVVLAASFGLFTEDFYSRETPNWQIQSWGQDLVNLILVVPVLMLSAAFSFNKSRTGFIIWSGTNIYLLYTFIIYGFDIHFNSLFLLYCMNLGLSFFSCLYAGYQIATQKITSSITYTVLPKIASVFFLVVSLSFYGLWLMDIIPHLRQDEIPPSLAETGLPTNPVHVIDLSVLLPSVFVVGILLWLKKSFAFLLAPVILTFFIIMNITIGTLQILMVESGFADSLSVLWMMAGLSVISVVLLLAFISPYLKEPLLGYGTQPQ
jgi:hypothetical protein